MQKLSGDAAATDVISFTEQPGHALSPQQPAATSQAAGQTLTPTTSQDAAARQTGTSQTAVASLPVAASQDVAASFAAVPSEAAAAAKRAARKQHLAKQRKDPMTHLAGISKNVVPHHNRRGGAGTPATCSVCKQLRKGTHGKSGCSTHCTTCLQAW